MLVWVGAAMVAIVFATDTKVGPVLVKFARGHGLHLGDALVSFVAIMTAVALTWFLVRPRLMVRRGASTRGVGK
jgi:hypothetical protein